MLIYSGLIFTLTAHGENTGRLVLSLVIYVKQIVQCTNQSGVCHKHNAGYNMVLAVYNLGQKNKN